MKVKFNSPQKVNGQELEELELEIETLKGKDIIELETAFRTLYKEYVPVPDVDIRYQALVAGRVAKINPKDLEELDASAFKEVCAAVRNFLIK